MDTEKLEQKFCKELMDWRTAQMYLFKTLPTLEKTKEYVKKYLTEYPKEIIEKHIK